MTSASEDRFRRLIESMMGAEYAGPLDGLAAAFGVDVGDPASWAELERRWEAIRPNVDVMSGHGSDSFSQVEATFQDVIDRYPDVFDPIALATHAPAIRMLIATRLVEGQVDNGGWPAVFYNAVDGHLPAAIEGYRLLGLPDHAALAARIQAHGWTEPGDDVPDDHAWDGFDALWFALSPAEDARARYIRAHADAFRT